MPHRELTQQQRLDYDAQAAVHGKAPETIGTYAARLADRVRFYRFFFFVPLYLALPLFLAAVRERRFLWVGLTLAVMALGTNFYPYFYPHYVAAGTCLLVLVTVVALEHLSRFQAGAQLARADPVSLRRAFRVLVRPAPGRRSIRSDGLRYAGTS